MERRQRASSYVHVNKIHRHYAVRVVSRGGIPRRILTTRRVSLFFHFPYPKPPPTRRFCSGVGDFRVPEWKRRRRYYVQLSSRTLNYSSDLRPPLKKGSRSEMKGKLARGKERMASFCRLRPWNSAILSLLKTPLLLPSFERSLKVPSNSVGIDDGARIFYFIPFFFDVSCVKMLLKGIWIIIDYRIVSTTYFLKYVPSKETSSWKN